MEQDKQGARPDVELVVDIYDARNGQLWVDGCFSGHVLVLPQGFVWRERADGAVVVEREEVVAMEQDNSQPQWVRHKSGQGEWWKVLNKDDTDYPHLWEVADHQDKVPTSCGSIWLPKSEYVGGPGPELWAPIRSGGVSIARMPALPESYRWAWREGILIVERRLR